MSESDRGPGKEGERDQDLMKSEPVDAEAWESKFRRNALSNLRARRPGFSLSQPLCPVLSMFGVRPKTPVTSHDEKSRGCPETTFFTPGEFLNTSRAARADQYQDADSTVKPGRAIFGPPIKQASDRSYHGAKFSSINNPYDGWQFGKPSNMMAHLALPQYPSRQAAFRPAPLLDSPFPWSSYDTSSECELQNATRAEYQQWKRAQLNFAWKGRMGQARGALAASVALIAVISMGSEGAARAGVEVKANDFEDQVGLVGSQGGATSLPRAWLAEEWLHG